MLHGLSAEWLLDDTLLDLLAGYLAAQLLIKLSPRLAIAVSLLPLLLLIPKSLATQDQNLQLMVSNLG
jgi:hypothetical protein